MLNATSAKKTVTLTNNGTATLTISSIAITGDFAQTNTCSTSVAAGASCSISITSTPSAIGTRSSTLSVTDNSSGSPQTVAVSGTGTQVKLAPTTLTFGSQAVNTTSAAQTITLTNVGSTSLNVTGISIIGTNAGDFSQTNTCGNSVAAGTSCTISVTFKPSATGTRTGAVSITDNGGSSPQKVSLSGCGQ